MSEIMRAEKLVNYFEESRVSVYYADDGSTDALEPGWRNELVDLIKSDRAAIIEKCKEAISKGAEFVEWDDSISQASHLPLDKISSILDSVLSEIEGAK